MTTEQRREKLINDIIYKYEGHRFTERINGLEGRISKSDLVMRINFINDEEARFLKEAKVASSRELTILRERIFPEKF